MERGKSKVGWKINYNFYGKKYYVFSEQSGVPAADYIYVPGKTLGGTIVSREQDSSADIK